MPKSSKPSVNSLAKGFFDGALKQGRTRVTNVELHEYVINKSGCTREVVHGTLDFTGPGTLADSEWYTERWRKEHDDSGRVVHVLNTDGRPQSEYDFDTPMKRRAVAEIFKFLPRTGTPRLLTLASHTGNCVIAALECNPHTIIDNIESDKDILTQWEAKKVRVGANTNDYLGQFEQFVSRPEFSETFYDLINADVMGYAGKKMHGWIQHVNKAKNCRYLAITTHKRDGFRNIGPFVEGLREKYAGVPDAHVTCITDWLDNFEMVERFHYKRHDRAQPMEVLIYEACK